jgi:hypothetical protein
MTQREDKKEELTGWETQMRVEKQREIQMDRERGEQR